MNWFWPATLARIELCFVSVERQTLQTMRWNIFLVFVDKHFQKNEKIKIDLLFRGEIQQQLPPLWLKILDILRLIQYQIFPFFPPKTLMILYN